MKKKPGRRLMSDPPGDRAGDWTFMTNHSHVLICLAADPEVRLREVADRVGITERAVQKIVADLEKAGVLTREKHGRRNHYRIQPEQPLRHPVEAHRRVRDLLEMVARGRRTSGD
ncbi:MAG: winged helix-turn-helix transcriptional regulator [Phycisphaeraceae bacterium]|nr:winged helix-turn-helix transcriptional regulator [Phycisphaeraceae bacterium]